MYQLLAAVVIAVQPKGVSTSMYRSMYAYQAVVYTKTKRKRSNQFGDIAPNVSLQQVGKSVARAWDNEGHTLVVVECAIYTLVPDVPGCTNIRVNPCQYQLQTSYRLWREDIGTHSSRTNSRL